MYTGRFAPSPTGPLHLGSLLAALGSFLEARQRGGRWLVRMEDVDAPRCVAGAADAILRTLEQLGLEWDGDVWVQSQRQAAYQDALAQLHRAGWAYPCACSRQRTAGRVYDGRCRAGLPPGTMARAMRVRVPARVIAVEDAVQGRHVWDLQQDIGDFIIRRADGFFAYQLAVTVDDAAQGVTHVVRGADLLHSTPRQIHLQTLLNVPRPHYMHLPVLMAAPGYKLSKQNHAPAIDPTHGATLLTHALTLLKQNPSPELAQTSVQECLDWAIAHWSPAQIPRCTELLGVG